MLHFLLLLTSSILASASAEGYSCPGNTLVNPPADLTVPYYFPNTWNESMEPALYAGNQMCNWQINVLEGMYATVTFYKYTEDESGITCVYPNGEEDYIEDKELNPYIFANPQFQVNLRVSDKQGRFSFKVVWAKYPSTCQMNLNLDDEKAMAGSPNECVTTFTAPNNVFFVGFTLQDDLDVLLRQSVIFEGDSVNGKYLGNLASARNNQIVSSGTKLTIYTFQLYRNFNYTLYMGMDTKAAGDVKHFTGLNCPSDPTKPCSVTINSAEQVSAVATVTQKTDYIETFLNFPAGATLDIYEGQISSDHLLTSMNRSNFINQLPVGVKNVLKIYHLDKGWISFPITRNATTADFGTVSDGQTVKIHSFDYRRYSYNQDTREVFSTYNNKEKLYFNFNVKYCDFNSQTTLACQVFRDGKIVFSETYTPSNPPPAFNLKVYGDQMSVDYQTNGNYTKGFEIDLVTTKNEDVTPSPTVTSSVLPSTRSLPSTMSTSSPRFSSIASSATRSSISTVSRSDSTTTNAPLPPGATTTLGPTPPKGQTTTMRISAGSSTAGRVETTTKGSGFQRISLILFITVMFVL